MSGDQPCLVQEREFGAGNRLSCLLGENAGGWNVGTRLHQEEPLAETRSVVLAVGSNGAPALAHDVEPIPGNVDPVSVLLPCALTTA